jgi:alkylhydroperoxidase/carboxymuconolactone decarboxylase family protein YurZ
MQDLRTLLSDDDLAALRAGFDVAVLSEAASSPFSVLYPPLDSWVKETSATFFDRSRLAPRDRERCIIVLLTVNGGLPVSLAIHIYWALMEGLSIDEICQTIGLTGAYGGVQRVAFGMTVLQRTLGVLTSCAKASSTQSATVVSAFIGELP